jgi:desulfoferrodoxin (superoxide reductase-like protein)
MKKLFTLIAVFCFSVTAVLANKTSVEVKAPSEVKAGTEITVTINVSHSANSKSHHTDWVYLKINGKEVQRWAYTKSELPPDSEFTVEYKLVVTEPVTIEAEGHCNIHGTKGPATAEVKTN